MAHAEWFYQAKGEQLGPLRAGQLRRLADCGVVTPDDFFTVSGDMLVRLGLQRRERELRGGDEAAVVNKVRTLKWRARPWLTS
jgi:hypothetical protein